jgi:hypothetical protein
MICHVVDHQPEQWISQEYAESYAPATACVQNRALQHNFVLETLCDHVVLLLASFPVLPMLLHRH